MNFGKSLLLSFALLAPTFATKANAQNMQQQMMLIKQQMDAQQKISEVSSNQLNWQNLVGSYQSALATWMGMGIPVSDAMGKISYGHSQRKVSDADLARMQHLMQESDRLVLSAGEIIMAASVTKARATSLFAAAVSQYSARDYVGALTSATASLEASITYTMTLQYANQAVILANMYAQQIVTFAKNIR